MLLEALIHDLSPSDIQSASNWLSCPLHNQRADVAQLFELLTKRDTTEGTEEECWSQLFPDRPYDNQKLRLLKSYLLKRLEEWLSFEEWRADQSLTGGIYLTRAYRRRNLAKSLGNRILRRRKSLAKKNGGGLADLQLAYELEAQALDLAVGKKRTVAHNLPALKQAGLALVCATQLRAACRTLSFGQIGKSNEDVAYLKAGLEAVERNDLSQQTGVQLFYLACLTLLDQDSEERYLAFEKTLFSELSSYARAEQKELLLIALNRCVRRINAGSRVDMERAFQLYSLGLDQELLYRNGILSNFTFSNIVGIALRLEEFTFVKHFLASHESRLPRENGAEVFALNAARYAYAIGKLESALVHLRRADYQDFIHHLNARTLLAKIYFELDYYNLLDSHLKNTRAILSRKKSRSYHLSNYRNFFSLLQKIQRLPAKKPTAAESLRARIEQTQPLTEKAWLLACLED